MYNRTLFSLKKKDSCQMLKKMNDEFQDEINQMNYFIHTLI